MAGFYTSSPLGLLVDPLNIKYDNNGKTYDSVFSSYAKFNKKQVFKSTNGSTKSGSGYQVTPILSKSPHSSEIYDVSTTNVIDRLDGLKHLSLNYADFAYLKSFGVYPNNRLVVARRYPKPVVDDLYSQSVDKVGYPISTVIGYLPEGDEDIIKLNFNEEWEAAEVSFVEILNQVGEDFGLKGQFKLGSILEGAVNVIPLPGASLLLQRKIMAQLGIFGEGVTFEEKEENGVRKGAFKDGKELSDVSTIPQGDPNLIKEAMNRSLIGENASGAGVKCKVSVTLKTTYEQKFINGVDPSKVFMDILNNCLSMGTSPSTFYLGKQVDRGNRIAKYLEDFMNDPFTKIKEFIESMIKAFGSQLDALDKKMKDAGKADEDKNKKDDKEKTLSEVIGSAIQSVPDYVKDFIRAKYKVKFMGIINALTGGPSTPWHITIGNPLRPIFCSGDMLCTSVDVNFGPQLSFNDLPTYIEVTVTLTSARNLGLQEIFAKFNTGGIRVTEGSLEGIYTSGESISFWNNDDFTKNYGATSSESKEKTSQEPNQADDTENTTNKTQEQLDGGLETKATEVSTNDTTSPTPSLTSDSQANPDPNSADPIIPSGTDENAQSIRTDVTQEMTGDTEGFTDQKQNPDDIPYTGQDSKSIQDKTTTGVVKTISEELDIIAGPPINYIITGTYDIDGKQVIGKGVATSESAAKTQAKQDALKKSK